MNRAFRAIAVVTGLVCVAHPAQAQIADKSTLQHSTVIDAPPAEVWKEISTSEGLKSWMAPLVEIDLRVGGKILSNYNAGGKIGDENTIENTILSFEPQRMLSIQATKPPANFPFAVSLKDMWTVMLLEPVGSDRTRLTISGMGFKDDAESVKMREFFDKGNAFTLDKLKKKFAKGTSPESDALSIVQRLVGGEWIFENKSENGVFRGRSIVEYGPDGKSMVARGWLGDATGMFYHGATQIWRDPESKTVRFQSLDEQGGLAMGEITSAGENSVAWDWNLAIPDGRKSRYRVDMVFSDTDHYEFILHELKADGSSPERVRVKYSRVSEAPAEYRKLKEKK